MLLFSLKSHFSQLCFCYVLPLEYVAYSKICAYSSSSCPILALLDGIKYLWPSACNTFLVISWREHQSRRKMEVDPCWLTGMTHLFFRSLSETSRLHLCKCTSSLWQTQLFVTLTQTVQFSFTEKKSGTFVTLYHLESWMEDSWSRSVLQKREWIGQETLLLYLSSSIKMSDQSIQAT